jgi:Tfp pilus assembly protein PilF
MTDDLYERYKEALRVGHVAVLRGSLNAAVDAYRAAADLAPSRALPHTSLGGVLLRLGRLEEALVEYASAVARAPRDEGALLGQAEALSVAGQRVDAAAALDQVAEIQADSGRLPEAADTLRRAIEFAETEDRARRQRELLRQIRLSEGDQAAEQLLARALRLRDEPAVAPEATVRPAAQVRSASPLAAPAPSAMIPPLPSAVAAQAATATEASQTAAETPELGQAVSESVEVEQVAAPASSSEGSAVEQPVQPVAVARKEAEPAAEARPLDVDADEIVVPALEAQATESAAKPVEEPIAAAAEAPDAVEEPERVESAEPVAFAIGAEGHGDGESAALESWDNWWKEEEGLTPIPPSANGEASRLGEAAAARSGSHEPAADSAPAAPPDADLDREPVPVAAFAGGEEAESPGTAAASASETAADVEAVDERARPQGVTVGQHPTEAPVVGVMDRPRDSGPGMSESQHQPSGDELLAAAESADLAGDASALRSLLLWTARAYAREGRFEAALDAAHRLLKAAPSDVDTHLVLVELYMARDWNALAAEKLALLERLAVLSGDEDTRKRICTVANRAFPRDERLGALCS